MRLHFSPSSLGRLLLGYLLLLLTPRHSSFARDNVKACCQKLLINGTLNRDPFYQKMMGTFTIYREFPWLGYEKRGDVSGKYPVYIHEFDDFVPTPERTNPPRVFLYFYLNENPDYPEKECKDRGCWILSMYDMEPGNFWWGKKWYHIKTKPTPKCPEHLTRGEARFINQNGDIDPGMIIQCMDDVK